MALTFPYSYIACPCADTDFDAVQQHSKAGRKTSGEKKPPLPEESEAEEQDFDPRAPRSAYSLYPLDHLLYCEDCHEIRCPRCVIDETACWFCPSCLIEQARASLGYYGCRCDRTCFQCPICSAPVSVTSFKRQSGRSGYILLCGHCNWDSTEINFIHDEPNGIRTALAETGPNGEQTWPISQLTKYYKMHAGRQARKEKHLDPEIFLERLQNQEPTRQERFELMRNFLANQVATVGASSYDIDQALNYASPGSFTRIMGLYNNIGGHGGRKKPRPVGMREANQVSEGFWPASNDEDEIEKLKSVGWTGTYSLEQQQTSGKNTRFVSNARPFQPYVRSKRSKRCRSCRHILVKPDAKAMSTRFRIKLVAANYIPAITLKSLQPENVNLNALTPLKPFHMILALRNPLFDPVKVTLATPSHTPGKFSSKVTILCPQFDIGQNTDVWDEALSTGAAGGSSTGSREKRRTKLEAAEGQAEAGKIWEQGRNWTSVIVEIVPASLEPLPKLGLMANAEQARNEEEDVKKIREDEDVLEIPMFVRVEYETDAHGEDGAASTQAAPTGKEQKEKRELAFWTVLGVGRIASPKT